MVRRLTKGWGLWGECKRIDSGMKETRIGGGKRVARGRMRTQSVRHQGGGTWGPGGNRRITARVGGIVP